MSNEGAIGESTAKRVGSHYVLDDVLGRGSMGTVWRGHDLNNGSACAIKILNPSLTTDKGATRRFIDERDILMSVDDDAVVRVTDILGILNKDVRWLDVEMPNTGAVNCAESLANLDSQGDRCALLQAVIRKGFQDSCEIRAINQFHDDGER